MSLRTRPSGEAGRIHQSLADCFCNDWRSSLRLACTQNAKATISPSRNAKTGGQRDNGTLLYVIHWLKLAERPQGAPKLHANNAGGIIP